MRYLLDTCLLSEFLKKLPNVGVRQWFDAQEEESLCLSVLAIGEIRKGITKLPESKRRTELELWLESLVRRYDKRILPFTIVSANLWGLLKGRLEKQGKVLSVIDSLMAATALEHDLTIVTRNEDDFMQTGVNLLNVWE